MFARLILPLIWISLATLSTDAAPPNIIVILADDMGYGDLGCMGSQYLRTPNIDALAESGVLCTQAYVPAPVCSPSRAGLLTGRDPRRFGYEGNLNKGDASYPTRPELLGLPPGEHTLGDHLRAAGYSTALIGKWHLGIGEGFHPNERGFDHFCGMLTGSHSYFPTQGKSHQIERNGEAVTEFSNDYLTDFFTDEGLAWIAAQENADDEKPFFAFFSYNAPHGPMHATEEDKALFPDIVDEKRRTYAAMMWALDRGVGRIHDALEKRGELDNTLIVFFSDNGGATNNSSWNGPLSGVKGCLKEGGVRVPMIWSWPGKIPPGIRHQAPVSALDLLPTFLAAAESEPLPLRDALSHEDKRNRERAIKKWGAYDGIDLLPELKNPDKATDRTLYWRLQGQTAILSGEEKLIRLSHRPAQMFRPGTDPAELSDLAPSGGERFEDLFRQLADWEATLPTVPLWGSSPMWSGESARNYDGWEPRPEPK